MKPARKEGRGRKRRPTRVTTPAAAALLLFASCGKEPEGRYVGSLSEWRLEVFETIGPFTMNGERYSIELTLRQVGVDKPARMLVTNLDRQKEKIRVGAWRPGDGNRTITFPDGNFSAQVYYLSKRFGKFVLEDSWGIASDEGRALVLRRDKVGSRKRSRKIEFSFEAGGKALFKGGAFERTGIAGEWELADGSVIANFVEEQSGERQKYFFHWKDDDLVLEKLSVYLPFFHRYHVRDPRKQELLGPFTIEQLREGVRKGEFSEVAEASHDRAYWTPVTKVRGYVEGDRPRKRKNWMYHVAFDEPPVLRSR